MFIWKKKNNVNALIDEIIPLEPTQVISEDYDECEDYDYDDVTEGSYIKVSNKLDSGVEDVSVNFSICYIMLNSWYL